ncbi:restriction endonuclease [Amycolatopsis sp. A133]|uniref:McrC family protein n=1 Tax=Amycolatopsis sp. A133 TaxID=3064472 RepID=UPI0027EE14E1|nr:restriction endonuclease [Amycolatopsis sp. A133]MDQ7809858.1 restriction endonuclease [Amycolatopsis sp. A133]
MTEPLELTETGRCTSPLTSGQLRALKACKFVTLTPPQPGSDDWTIAGNRGWVGVFWAADRQVRLVPKLGIARLLFLAGHGVRSSDQWFDEPGGMRTDEGVVPAVANMLWRQARRAIDTNLLSGYVPTTETSTTIRGKVRLADQLRRHYDREFPFEIGYDDFGVDIPENQILLAATTLLLDTRGLDAVSADRLNAIRRTLNGVSPLRRNAPLPSWHPTPQNAHYHSVLRLCELLLDASSPEHGQGGFATNGFVFNVEKVFESFVTEAVNTALKERIPGRGFPQYEWHLDEGRKLKMNPDLVWQIDGRPAVVVDAKYKRKQPADDFYQLLAYCAALGVGHGHLVYASGEPGEVRHKARGGGYQLFAHTLDLMRPRAELLTQIDRIADRIAELTNTK